MPLPWEKSPDPARAGAELWSVYFDDGSYVTVQEVSAGDWGWVLSNADGFPRRLHYGLATPDAAKEHFETNVDLG